MEGDGLVHLQGYCTFDPHRHTRGRSHDTPSLSETIDIFLFGFLLALKTEATWTLWIIMKEGSKCTSCPTLSFRGLSEQTFFFFFWKTSTSSVDLGTYSLHDQTLLYSYSHFSQLSDSCTLMLSYLKLEQTHVNTLTTYLIIILKV